MNKTLTINLAGLVFNIEENAYQILKDYLVAIKNQFKKPIQNIHADMD